jgi:hypothetical protein
MCENKTCTLTLETLLRDPLVHLVMLSDNVSTSDHSELLLRVQESLIARNSVAETRMLAAL